MSDAWPKDAYSVKVTVTLESKVGDTLPGKDSDMNVQATKVARSVELKGCND